MSLIARMRRQTAVYWAINSDTLDSYGKPSYADPVEIKVRWEEKQVEFLDPQGNKVLSQAVIYVGQDMKAGELLYLGRLTDSGLDRNTPKNNLTAYSVRAFTKLPNLKATEYLRTVYI